MKSILIKIVIGSTPSYNTDNNRTTILIHKVVMGEAKTQSQGIFDLGKSLNRNFYFIDSWGGRVFFNEINKIQSFILLMGVQEKL